MDGVAFATDRSGDVYLTGRLPNSAVTPEEIDRLLGAVLSYADDSFNTMLEIGFGSSIRREWEWRGERGGGRGAPGGSGGFRSPPPPPPAAPAPAPAGARDAAGTRLRGAP